HARPHKALHLQGLLDPFEKRLNCPETSGAGRLFDAVSALLGLCLFSSYEGQAAMRLEQAALASPPLPAGLSGDLACQERNGLLTLPSKALFGLLAERFREGADACACARLFHEELARLLCELCVLGRERTGLSSVALAGGVMQNRLLAGLLTEGLARLGFDLFLNRLLPPGDGGIAYGQACWGARLLALGKALEA
ncbi:MAG: hydrogenase maturation protein HypF, partial [Desulfovibrio sp.]|nr:hydrogenase maturation protein HypF [Desulfovibrio sp.]